MKLATVALNGAGDRVALVEDDSVYPFPQGMTMRQVIDAGLEQARHLARQARSGASVSLANAELRVPLEPAAVRDFVAFEEHVEGVRRSVDGATGVPDAWYDAPTFYFTNPHTLTGPSVDVAFPASSVARDFELEVAAIVGPDQSIFGYTIFNDWSARDLQSRE